MKKTLIAVLVVLAIAVLAGVCNVWRRESVKSAQPCWSNLLSIEGAKETWALETHAPPGTPVTLSNLLPYLSVAPTCPVAGATYIIGRVGDEPRCTTHGTVSNFKPDRY
jgi:hypothetical protein